MAVVYADWKTASSPSPDEVLSVARQSGCCTILVDTFDKSGGSLLDLWKLPATGNFIERSHADRLRIALAGRLTLDDIACLLPLQPDWVGVRGAVCVGGREGILSSERVRQLAERVHGGAAEPHRIRSARLPGATILARPPKT